MRVKIAYLTENQILGCFECVDTGSPYLRDPGSCNQLRRVRLKGVPEEARVVRVFHDHSRMAFGFVIEHESFPDVPFGNIPDTIECEIVLFQVDHEGKTIGLRDGHTYEKLFEYPRPDEGKKPDLHDIIKKCSNPEPPAEPTTWRDRPSLL